MKRKWLIWLIILLVLLIAFGGLYAYCSSRVDVSYGEKSVLAPEQSDNQAYLDAWAECTDLTAACQENWKGNWPDYFGGFGVVENEGAYLVNVYLTEDTEANRKAVCEAAGKSLRAYTKTTVSWKQLQQTLRRVDTIKSIPGVNVLSMGINTQDRCVRVFLARRDLPTTIALGLVKGPIEVSIIPVQPTIRTAVRETDGTISLELGGLTYSNRCTVEVSTDAAFEQEVQSIDLDNNDSEIQLPDPGEGEAWYVRARAYKEVDGTTYTSDWSAAKTIRSAQ